MTAVTPGTVISVQTSKHAYKCTNLVLALGPWAAKFLPRLGLELPLQVGVIDLALDVQRNANLMNPSRRKHIYSTLSNTLLLLLERKFETVVNDDVNFEQPVPGWYVGRWCICVRYSFISEVLG